MSLNAFAIMLKPLLAKQLEPLEENGTLDKLRADIELVAKSNAIPELATLVSEMKRHNDMMERLFALADHQLNTKGVDDHDGQSFSDAIARCVDPSLPRTDTGAAGLVRDSRAGMYGNNVSD